MFMSELSHALNYTHTQTHTPQAVKQTRVQHDQQEKVISNQQRLLKQSLHQNNELRERLTQIQNIASGVEYSNTRMGTPGSMRMSPSLQSSHTGTVYVISNAA